MEQSRSPALSFFLDEETGDLQARFDPAGEMPPPDMAIVKQAIRDEGWGELYLDDKALADFVIRCRSVREVSEQIVGARRDGEFALTFSDDMMIARLTLIAPQGGKPVGDQVVDALREQGVVYGLLHQQIDAALAAGHCEDLVIARGDSPVEGTPTRFEALFMEQEKQPASLDDRAVIKYSDLSHLLLVHPGDRLMRRIAPTASTNGTNIKGEPVLAKPIPDLPFAHDLQGAAPDSKDPNLLRATLAGQPMLADNGVIVNPVIEVPDVDLSTGNIDFEGTIRVTGDVKAGMRIKVTGDVIVSGTVEAAHIVAGGNVAVQGGVIGHADTHAGAQSLPASTARIICQGSAQALFMEHAHIEAGDAILIDRSARQCELIAQNEIIVGKAGSKISQIIGGLSQASLLVKASMLGSSTGIKTQVQVGFDPYLHEQLQDKERLLQQKFEEIDRVLKLIIYFEHNPKKAEGGVGAKVEATRVQLLCDINALSEEIKQLSDESELMDKGRVEVAKTIYYGVEVRVGQQVWQAPDDINGAVIRIQDGKIIAD